MSASTSATENAASSGAPAGEVVLAIDIGTQTTRAALVSAAGDIVDSAGTAIALSTPRPGRAEQNPDEWWTSTVANIRAVLSRNPAVRVEAIGVGAQMHGVVPVGADGDALVDRVGLWNDKRAAEISQRIADSDQAGTLRTIAGNAPTPAWPAMKMRWFAENEPDVFARTSHFLVVKDFIVFRLTGRASTDPTEASGSFLADARTGEWSDVLIEALGVRRSALPPIVASSAVAGHVNDSCSTATGLPSGTPVVAGAGDMLCQLAATGLHRAGRVTEISGTATIIAGYHNSPHPDPRVMNLRSAGDGWVHFGIADAGGVGLRWLADTLCEEQSRAAVGSGTDRYDLLTALAARVPAGADGVVFCPSMLGERTLGSAHARGGFLGLTPGHDRGTMVRAVLEGVCFEMKRALDLITERQPLERVRVTGGGARSACWNGIRAGIYDVPVARLRCPEGGLLGAALLAGVGAGWYPDVAAGADEIVGEADETLPADEDRSAYDSAYERFCRVHDAVDPLWKDW